mgnify:CR=1 FL=1
MALAADPDSETPFERIRVSPIAGALGARAARDGMDAVRTLSSGSANLPVEALIDAQPVRVLFAGAAPGTVGLYQVNVAVPALGAGEHDAEVRVAGESARFSFRATQRQ